MRFLRKHSPLLPYLLCFLFLASCQTQTQEQTEETTTAASTEGRYRVIAIKDGDTIELLKDGKPVRVRLQGVDCPEKNQDFGTRARQFTSDLCFGKDVELEIVDTDRYGRTVGIITLPDGKVLNNELIEAGFAWHYKAYSKDPELAALEDLARSEKRGLWAGPSPVAPWDFRKQKKSGNSASSTPKSTSPKKDASNKPVSKTAAVYLCDSQGATTYHLNQECRALSTCKSKIISVTQAAASAKTRKACRVCAS